ncbi:hypothetical protein FB451DRAFT_1193588 [Mycena latifolia]|nr:hypothetical protein FB451DRAFT_1193588 [Mycena latifolia]
MYQVLARVVWERELQEGIRLLGGEVRLRAQASLACAPGVDALQGAQLSVVSSLNTPSQQAPLLSVPSHPSHPAATQAGPAFTRARFTSGQAKLPRTGTANARAACVAGWWRVPSPGPAPEGRLASRDVRMSMTRKAEPGRRRKRPRFGGSVTVRLLHAATLAQPAFGARALPSPRRHGSLLTNAIPPYNDPCNAKCDQATSNLGPVARVRGGRKEVKGLLSWNGLTCFVRNGGPGPQDQSTYLRKSEWAAAAFKCARDCKVTVYVRGTEPLGSLVVKRELPLVTILHGIRSSWAASSRVWHFNKYIEHGARTAARTPAAPRVPLDKTMCKRWLERAAVALLAACSSSSHFLLAVPAHYAHLVPATTANGGPPAGAAQALRLLPLPPNVRTADAPVSLWCLQRVEGRTTRQGRSALARGRTERTPNTDGVSGAGHPIGSGSASGDGTRNSTSSLEVDSRFDSELNRYHSSLAFRADALCQKIGHLCLGRVPIALIEHRGSTDGITESGNTISGAWVRSARARGYRARRFNLKQDLNYPIGTIRSRHVAQAHSFNGVEEDSFIKTGTRRTLL